MSGYFIETGLCWLKAGYLTTNDQKTWQAAAAAKTKEAKVVKKAEKKLNDPRSDPIPKPPMFPTSRPPRGLLPKKAIHNSSLGVAAAVKANDSLSSRGESVLGVSPSLAVSCPALSGRDSVDSGHSEVIQVT